MALESTGIPDSQSAAAYFITDGSSASERILKSIADEVDLALPDEVQVVLLDGRHGEGLQVVDFYDLISLPAVLIVMDDDQIYHMWTAPHLPTASNLMYTMRQAGVPLRGD